MEAVAFESVTHLAPPKEPPLEHKTAISMAAMESYSENQTEARMDHSSDLPTVGTEANSDEAMVPRLGSKLGPPTVEMDTHWALRKDLMETEC